MAVFPMENIEHVHRNAFCLIHLCDTQMCMCARMRTHTHTQTERQDDPEE